MDDKAKHRRCKLLYIDKHEVLDVFRVLSRQHDILSVPCFSELPEGYEVLGVGFDFAYDAFGFQIHHPTFEEVPVGAKLPHIRSMIEMKQTTYRRAGSYSEKCEQPLYMSITAERLDPAKLQELMKHQNGEVRFYSGAEIAGEHVSPAEVWKIHGDDIRVTLDPITPPEPPKPQKKSWEFLGAP